MVEVSAMSNSNVITIRGHKGILVGMALTFILFCHTAAVSAQDPCWTTVGSAGTVDEADLGTVALSTNTAAVSGAATNAIVDIRYNVVAVDGVFGGERNTKTLSARFADNGAAAQVIVRLQRLNIFNGVTTTLAELNSNAFPPSTVAQTRGTSFNCQNAEFDFVNNIYYLDVPLIKTGSSGNPLVRAIQICGNGIC